MRDATVDAATLQMFIARELVSLVDFFSIQNHSYLHQYRAEIDQYLKDYRQVLTQLDLTQWKSVNFLTTLLDVSDRMALPFAFEYLFDQLQKAGSILPKRLVAAHRYLVEIQTASASLENLESVCHLLQVAFEEEEDAIKGVIATLANQYALVVYDFGDCNLEFVRRFRQALMMLREARAINFMMDDFIHRLLEVDLTNYREAYSVIQSLTDDFLSRRTTVAYRRKGHFVEQDTDYCLRLQDCRTDFMAIRELSVELHGQNPNRDAAFQSLRRGVAVLDSEEALHAYTTAFGQMHAAKLFSAFEHLPLENFPTNALVVDWACGQGFATMAFLAFLQDKGLNFEGSVLLIEPSELAIRRASLHVKKWIGNPARIHTIQSDFDSLIAEDLDHFPGIAKVHLFSNILDVEFFQLGLLISLIKENFKGTNYFVCVSPFIYDSRRNRIDLFVEYFTSKSDSELLFEAENTKGTWAGHGDWTRIIRVFKIVL